MSQPAIPAYADYLRDTPFVSPTGPLNAWELCCGRYVGQGREALTWIDTDERIHHVGFDEFDRRSARFANLLAERGIGAGDVVAGLLPRRPELLEVILGTWRVGAAYQPLFTAFGPKAIAHRLTSSGARLVVTVAEQRAKLDEVNGAPPTLTVGSGDMEDYAAAMARQGEWFAPVPRQPEDPFLVMFTSGTTGLPKQLRVPLRAVAAIEGYMRHAVDLREDDVLWNIADPGWAYGLYYGVVGPLLLGHATTFHEGGFTVESCYATIRRLGVTNLLGAPTAYRMLMAAGDAPTAALRGQLRVASSAGEPLNPEVIRWFERVLGTRLHDHYGQTETGMTVCNHHALAHPVRVGSAGFASPGFTVAVLDESLRPLPPGQPGMLAIDVARSPALFFVGYHGQEQDAFRDGWYLTGDTVELNDDGSIAFVGRNDDVITSSGYRIGPFDVESCLVEHPAVAEAAVVGKPDPQRTEIVKAYVVPRAGYAADEALRAALTEHVRTRLSTHAYPREIEFLDALPKTPSGKIQRFLLRQQARAEAEQQAGNTPAG
ncbi:AMP-binding protein [Aerosticca soli]|uniref:Acyl-CoA synthetases/AMP-acid ligases n=1 Tax=Aerosticca soli TaxID=2010829 RepID=A0A2Z6E441_9GAMM|nr:AMP-binding protein [Aerosticca soli]BBD79865.1 acyl-CoA synthetases/AMP-acid ligases [Aerosticca soli]